jgi:hypothetical protein
MSFAFTDFALCDWTPTLRLFLPPTLSMVEALSARRRHSIRRYVPATWMPATLSASRCEWGSASPLWG